MIQYLFQRSFVLGLLCMLAAPAVFAQTTYTPRQMWAVLGKVTFTGNSADVLTMSFSPPKYGQEVLALDGKEITIEGYVMPLDFGKAYFVISAYPFASCFFCGGAGPETVMEVYLKKWKKTTSEKVTVKGRLVLNKGQAEHLTYMLKEAVLVEK